MVGVIPTPRGGYELASPVMIASDPETGRMAVSSGGVVTEVGDTGVLDITSRFLSMREGVSSIRRVGGLVTFTMDVARFTDEGTFTLAGVVPAGFRPGSVFNGFAVQLSGTDGWRVGISTGGNLSMYTYTGGWVRFSFTYATTDPWPDPLPS